MSPIFKQWLPIKSLSVLGVTLRQYHLKVLKVLKVFKYAGCYVGQCFPPIRVHTSVCAYSETGAKKVPQSS